MRRLLACLLVLAASTVAMAEWRDIRTFSTEGDVRHVDRDAPDLFWGQAETVYWEHTAMRGNRPHNLDGTNLVYRWYVMQDTNAFLVITGQVLNAASGRLSFRLVPEESNLTPGSYVGRVISVEGEHVNRGEIARANITVRYSPKGDNFDLVGPIPSFGDAPDDGQQYVRQNQSWQSLGSINFNGTWEDLGGDQSSVSVLGFGGAGTMAQQSSTNYYTIAEVDDTFARIDDVPDLADVAGLEGRLDTIEAWPTSDWDTGYAVSTNLGPRVDAIEAWPTSDWDTGYAVSTNLGPRVDQLEYDSIPRVHTNLNFITGVYQHETNVTGRIIPSGGYWHGSLGSGFNAFRYREIAPSPGPGLGPIMAPVVEEVYKAGNDYGRMWHRLALYDETVQVNEKTSGAVTDMTGFGQVTTNLWRIVQGPGGLTYGWEVQAQSLSGGTATLMPGDYVRWSVIPTFVSGISEVIIDSSGHFNNVRFEVQVSTNNFSTWTTNGLFSPLVNQESGYSMLETRRDVGVRLVYVDKYPLIPNEPLSVEINSMRVRSWSKAGNVGVTNDTAGVILLVDNTTGGGGRQAVNRQSLDLVDARLQLGINLINPSLVGVNANQNPVRFGHRWRMQESAETLRMDYLGQDVFWFSNGGTTFPNTVWFSSDASNVTLRVIANDNSEPKPQFSTNLVTGSWDWVSEYSTTWPALTNGTVDITFSRTNFPAMTAFRAAVTTAVETATAAHWLLDIEMYGREIRDGVYLGDAAGLTGANASTLFGSGTIPVEYLPSGSLSWWELPAEDDVVIGAEGTGQGESHKLVFEQFSIGENMGYTNYFWFRSGLPYVGPAVESNRVMTAAGVDDKIAEIYPVSDISPSVWTNIPALALPSSADAVALSIGPMPSGFNSRRMNFVSASGQTNQLYTVGSDLVYTRDGAPAAVWHALNMNPSAYLTVSGFNASQTNAMRVFQGAPTSNTMHGSRRDVWVDSANTNIYFYSGTPPGTSRWIRVHGEYM